MKDGKVDLATPEHLASLAARAKLHNEIDEILTELKVEECPTFAGIQMDLLIDDTAQPRRLCAIRLVPIDQAPDGTLSRRIER